MTPKEMKALRKKLRLTQDDLATKLDVGLATVQRYEQGINQRDEIPRTVELAMLYLEQIIHPVYRSVLIRLNDEVSLLTPEELAGLVYFDLMGKIEPLRVAIYKETTRDAPVASEPMQTEKGAFMLRPAQAPATPEDPFPNADEIMAKILGEGA